MSILNVFNVPTTPQELAQWSFLHMALHRDENLAIRRQNNILLPEYVLDPMDLTPNSAWFQQHQLMHNNIDQILGVAQFDLIDVDWSDPAQRVGWIQGHAQLHQQETKALDVFS
jgi:hypothetical protein